MRSFLRLSPLFFAFAALLSARGAEGVQFNRDIRPMLSDNCFYCHGPDKSHREAELRLDIREEALKERDGVKAIVPGKPDESELVLRIFTEEKDDRMPPVKAHKELTAAQKELFKRWVAEGAEYQPHWAYVPLASSTKDIPPPAGEAKQAIDQFVQASLAAKGIQPSPEAEPRALCRRVYLDLIGIPPTPEEVEVFVQSAKADRQTAMEQLVDKLLASPHFGERMASPWLDVARYADTVGFHGDQNMNAWAYRDYVIDSFNKNKRFDQFTIEQLAGDLLPNPTPEQLTATCFNRLTMMTREGGAQAKEYLAKYTADRVRTVSMAWLGSTLGCAECHDHKFDPWTSKDFYALGAFFADVKQWGVYNDYSYTPNPDLKGFSNEHPFPPEITVESPYLLRRKADLEKRMSAKIANAAKELQPEEVEQWANDVRAFLIENPSGWAKAEFVEPPVPKATADPNVKQDPDATENPKTTEDPDATQDPKGTAGAEVKAPDVAKATRAKKVASAKAKKGAELASLWAIEGAKVAVAAILTEVGPGVGKDGKMKDGQRGALKVSAEIEGADGKKRPVGIFHADADFKSSKYSNGFEVPGVKDGWTLAKQAGAQHAVWLLDKPTQIEDGEKLIVTTSGDAVGELHVTWSPLAALDPLKVGDAATREAIDAENRNEAQAQLVRAAYYLSTGADAEFKNLYRDWLETRGGRTPVLVTERTDKPLTARVLARGNWMDESGEIVQPATAHFLPQPGDAADRQLTRLDLAKWLVSPENPLTARVIMNRLWKQLFGTGLSAQIEDLGAQGEPPSHPELLDWLAVEFRSSGWDFKHMVRTIVLSHTYRQSAKLRPELHDADPQNRLLASQNPRRLEAEVVRDNALAIAGLLNGEVGGPPAKPYQPGGYYVTLQFPDRDYVADKGAQQWRRGVYSHWQRTFMHPMLANFDAPSREDCVALRTNANTPQQALTLLNDPEFVEAARVWAAGVLGSMEKTDSDRIDGAFAQAVARKPSEKERERLLGVLEKAREEYQQRPDDAAKLLKTGIAPAPQGDAVELAAWTTVCRVILNLHETITRF